MGHGVISIQSSLSECVLGQVFPGSSCSLQLHDQPRASWGSALLDSLHGALAGTVWKIYPDPMLPLAALL